MVDQSSTQPGWVARTFTRARVVGVYVARIPFGDKSFELPIVLSRVQLGALGIGTAAAVVAYVIGSSLGIAAWLVWPVLIIMAGAVVALGYSSAPDRGVMLTLEGYARMVWAGLPLTRSEASSCTSGSVKIAPLRMTLHPPLDAGEGRG